MAHESMTGQELRDARVRALHPISATLTERGVRQTWLAQQIGIDRFSLSKYLHGVHRPPDWFIAAACQALSIPQSLIVIPEPRDLYVQPGNSGKPAARNASSTGKPSANTGRGHQSQRQHARGDVRRKRGPSTLVSASA